MRYDSIVLLLGGNKLNRGILEKFSNKGHKVFVVDWNDHPDLIGDKHYQIDVKDYESIIWTLKKDGYWDNVSWVYSSMDPAVESVARINHEIGLSTISDEGLRFSSSKSKMTSKWAEDGLLNRFSKCYTEFDDEIFQLNSKMKIIIKPDNSASSRGITIIEKNSNIEFVKNAYDKARNEASNNSVVVEEFIEGTEYTVEMIGDLYGEVMVYGISRKTHTKYTDNNRIAIKLHYNFEDTELQEKIADYAIRCYRSLQFISSLAHLEIIIKPDGGISPIEIGARSSGFIASDLVDIVSGEDFLGKLINVQNGEAVTTGLHPQTDFSSMYFFYDFPDNSIVIKEKSLIDFCDQRIISRYWDRTNIKVGNCFTKIENDNARIGFEVLEGPQNVMTMDYISEREREMIDEVIPYSEASRLAHIRKYGQVLEEEYTEDGIRVKGYL